MKQKWLLAFFVFCPLCFHAQESFQQSYEEFKQQANQDYESFRNKANEEYAQWIEHAWQWYKVFPAKPKPKDDSRPPILFDKNKQLNGPTPQPYDTILNIPKFTVSPQPKPISPIRQNDKSKTEFVFEFFGTRFSCHLPDEMQWNVTPFKESKCAYAWRELSSDKYNNLIRDCLSIRIQYRLCDWAYMLMLKCLADAKCGKGTNEASFLLTFLMCQSGYKVRLACSRDGRIFMIFHSDHLILYGLSGVQIGEELFYFIDDVKEEVALCPSEFPGEQGVSLWIKQSPMLATQMTPTRQIDIKQTPLKIECSVNKNLIDFFNTYPVSLLGDNVMTKWSIYANTPMSEALRVKLYPQLKKLISGLSELDAVNLLMYWIQFGMKYEYDDKIWGYDRPFFAEETLYYPYCDCEDRAILLSRLVRDLLGLKVILVYYPGHLLSAICFNENVIGDYFTINNSKFIIADPTYIGAPVGAIAPEYNNKTAKIILLE